MAAKVPKFGAWEGGENFTVYFDNARKTKQNGPMINPNDPQENPGMFPQKGAPAQAPSNHKRGESQGQQAKVPQFGAWDSGDNVGYTVYFENARKTKTTGGGPTGPEPEPKVKPGQETRPKVPQFGAWGDQGGGEVAYTMCFDNVRKNKGSPPNVEEPSREPQLNRDAGPPPPPAQDARVKVPEFGVWNGGEESVAYTACFDNPRKNKSGGSGPVLVEPQFNRDVGGATNKARPEQRGAKQDGHVRNASRGSIGSTVGSERHGRQTPVGQSPLHPRGGKATQSKSGNRGGQNPEKVATIPAFGVWNDDPSKAEGFTGTFARAKQERVTPLHSHAPPSYHNQTPQSKQEPKKSCWTACFG